MDPITTPVSPKTTAKFERSEWRLLIEDEPRSGAENMAIDHAIALSCAQGDSLPTLRFYRWEPPAVTLGRNQPASEINQERVAELGYGLVRRTTGGRAILHIDELTYSVLAPRTEPRVAGGVMDAYLRLSNGLLAGLAQLGVQADKAGADVRAGKDVSAACFEVPSAYEITVGGRKLMGSAQSRKRDFVLQHGTLPLVGDITRLIELLYLSDAEQALLSAQLESRACTLHSVLPTDSPLLSNNTPLTDSSKFTQIGQILAQGFSEVLNLDFPSIHTVPTERELVLASQLLDDQYTKDSWTFSR